MKQLINWKGATCTYTKSGKGKTIFLLHGFVEEGSLWTSTAKWLTENYCVIVPDLPGFGNSALPARHKNWQISDYADFVLAIADKEKITSFHVFGHSMGGYTALAIAKKAPEKIISLGLINSHCFADTADKMANRKKGNEFIAQYGSLPFVKEILPNLFTPAFLSKNAALIKKLVEQAGMYSPEGLMAANSAMANRPDNSEVLCQLKVPILLVSGKTDEAVPLSISLQQVPLGKVVDFHLFKQTKHVAMLEESKRFKQVVLHFLAIS
jgi:pimeloyl-ACP methyl ester carboxylesterase